MNELPPQDSIKHIIKAFNQSDETIQPYLEEIIKNIMQNKSLKQKMIAFLPHKIKILSKQKKKDYYLSEQEHEGDELFNFIAHIEQQGGKHTPSQFKAFNKYEMLNDKI